MKRSTQIGLIVAGALGVTSAGAYYMKQRNDACRNSPERTDRDCRGSGSSSSSGHGSGHALFGGSSTSSPSSPSSTSTQPGSAQRGGFGSTGRAIGLFSGS